MLKEDEEKAKNRVEVAKKYQEAAAKSLKDAITNKDMAGITAAQEMVEESNKKMAVALNHNSALLTQRKVIGEKRKKKQSQLLMTRFTKKKD